MFTWKYDLTKCRNWIDDIMLYPGFHMLTFFSIYQPEKTIFVEVWFKQKYYGKKNKIPVSFLGFQHNRDF